MSDLLGWALILSPFWLAALLLGVAVLGPRLGERRRMAIETFLLLPLAVLLLGAHGVNGALEGKWGQAVFGAVTAIVYAGYILKHRAGGSHHSTTPGTGASA